MLKRYDSSESEDLLEKSIEWRKKIAPLLKCSVDQASDGELAALISFAIAFPHNFVALIDTYDVSRSVIIDLFVNNNQAMGILSRRFVSQ